MKIDILASDIFVIPDFISEDEAEKLLQYFEYRKNEWEVNGFFESYALNVSMSENKIEDVGLDPDYLINLFFKMQDAVQECFGREVTRVANHIQKWNTGAWSQWHSDNSDADGRPNAWEMNKYASIIYVNDDFGGGELEFKNGLIYKPVARSLIVFNGGAHNTHKVNQVESGVRYTAGAFWDHADAFYSEDRRAEWAEEIRKTREQQANQYSEWSNNHDIYVDYPKTNL